MQKFKIVQFVAIVILLLPFSSHANDIKARDFFSISALNQPVSVFPGTSLFIFTVPNNKHLVITDINVTPKNLLSINPGLTELESGASTPIDRLYPDAYTRLIVGDAAPYSYQYRSETGLLFKKGSQIGIKNASIIPMTSISYSLVGYYVSK